MLFVMRLEGSEGEWCWEDRKLFGHNFDSDCPIEKEVDKSEELKVFGGSSYPSREEKIEGVVVVDSLRVLIFCSSVSISTDAACFIGKS